MTRQTLGGASTSSPTSARHRTGPSFARGPVGFLTAVALWLTACDSSTVITGIEGGPDPEVLATAELTIVGGDNQDAVVGEAAPEPLRVRITDADGTPLAGAPVHWIFTQGNGQGTAGSQLRDSVSITSDAEGEVSVTWILGERAGAQTALAQIVVPDVGSSAPAAGAPPAHVRERKSFRANARHSSPRTVEVTPSSVSLAMGNTVTLDAVVEDRYGNPVPTVDLTWSSDDPSIASVEAESGELVGMAEGTTTVVAQYQSLSGASSVGVTADSDTIPDPDPVLQSLEIRRTGTTASVTSLSLSLGQTASLEVMGLDGDGNDLGTVAAQWSSSDSQAASVSPSGDVTASAPGSSRVSAEFDGHTAFVDVTVYATASGRLFSSDWSTATGGSQEALRDTGNDGWDTTICTSHGLLEVVPPSSLPSEFGAAPPSTTTGNVLRTEYSADGGCGNVEVHLDGPDELVPGQDYWLRYYLRVDPGVYSRGVAHYETVSVFDYRNLTFNSPHADGMGDQWAPVPRIEGSAEYPFRRWSGGYDTDGNPTRLLDDGEWYRFEFHVEFLADLSDPGPTGGNHLGPHGSWASENADCEFRVWPRVYDANGNLVLDASNYGQQEFGIQNVAPLGSRWSLQDYYDAGFTYLCTNRSLGSGLRAMRYFGIGNNGATSGSAPASNGSQYFYYMNYAISTAGWIGSTP